MDLPSASFISPIFPATKHLPPENRAAPSEYQNRKSPEIPASRDQWVSRIIEAQASRVVHDTGDAIELKPVTVESQPPAKVQRFLEVTSSRTTRGGVIDTYA